MPDNVLHAGLHKFANNWSTSERCESSPKLSHVLDAASRLSKSPLPSIALECQASGQFVIEILDLNIKAIVTFNVSSEPLRWERCLEHEARLVLKNMARGSSRSGHEVR